ncbi:hypothetical protein [Moraxella lacunata]
MMALRPTWKSIRPSRLSRCPKQMSLMILNFMKSCRPVNFKQGRV